MTVEPSMSVSLSNSTCSKTSSKRVQGFKRTWERKKKANTSHGLIMTKFSIPFSLQSWVNWFLTCRIQIISPPILWQPHIWQLGFNQVVLQHWDSKAPGLCFWWALPLLCVSPSSDKWLIPDIFCLLPNALATREWFQILLWRMYPHRHHSLHLFIPYPFN